MGFFLNETNINHSNPIASKSGPNIQTETISFWIIILITLIFSNNQTFKGILNGFNNLFVLENEKSTYQNTSSSAR